MKIQRRFQKSSRSGFTLLEVLLVLAIIIAMMAIVVPNFLGRKQEADIKSTVIAIKNFEQAAKLYAAENKGYPKGSAEEVVQQLMAPVDEITQRPKPPYIEETPIDAWGNPLMYEFPATGERPTLGGKPAIWSAGVDGQEGTEDDTNLNNWTTQNTADL